MANQIKKFLRERRDKLVLLTQQLVRIRSVNSGETEVAKHLVSVLRAYDIRAELIGSRASRKSLVARVGTGKRTLMLNAHLDTVAPGDSALWADDPYSGRMSSGKVFGRGSYDLKGAVASIVFAAAAVKALSPRYPGTLLLVLNADEESGHHSGIKEVLERGVSADAAICCEPMFGETLAIGAKGIFRFELETQGTAGHTGFPNGRINSVTKMAKLLLALEGSKFKWRKHPMFSPPYVTPGTVIEGGTAINVFPERCRALVDCRLALGQSLDAVRRAIVTVLERVRAADSDVRYSLREIGYVPAALTDPDHDFVSLSAEIISRVHGFVPNVGVVDGVTDGNFLMDNGIPTVIYGPTGANIHAANEWVSIPSLLKAAECYATTAMRFVE